VRGTGLNAAKNNHGAHPFWDLASSFVEFCQRHSGHFVQQGMNSVGQPPQPAAQLQHDHVHGSLEALGNPDAQRRGETLAASSTNRTKHNMKSSTNRLPIMIEVPPARIPEEPGAVIPHAGICKGGVGQPTSLP
jgi:hypothetical protein